MGLNPKGRNWGNLVNWDDLGKFYASFIIAWTIVLYAGAIWLFNNRKLPFIRIRNLPLAVAAISFLHVYLVKILLAYTTNGHFECSAEFWIMSIYLPFGIALFQANLAQLRSISEQQQQFVHAPHHPRGYGLWQRWQSLSYLTKTYVVIGAGMICQFIITGALYATTPTLRGDWSSYGKLSHAKGQAKCRKSLEWIPSAFWQLFYSWFYGPYILLKIRNIHDTHYWRLQVILSVISGLPGTPLWLAALFSTSFKAVNRRWVPPMWLAPGIIVMQAVTIFFPIYEAVKSRKECQTTLSIIKEWEDQRNNSQRHLVSSSSDRTSGRLSTQASTNASSLRKAHMHTMAGLEKALNINPEPLLQFAATRDFTAENVAFLLQVQQWRTAYLNAPKLGNQPSCWSNLYATATKIYMASVNEKTCTFPINIESRIRSDLDAVFSRAVPDAKQQATHDQGGLDLARPNANREDSSDSADTILNDMKSYMPRIAATTPPEQDAEFTFPHHPGVSPLGEARANIPPNFDEHVFDEAEKSIKYLVLTNTWQKFVRSRENEQILGEVSPS